MGTAKTNIQDVKFNRRKRPKAHSGIVSGRHQKKSREFPDSVILTEGHLCRL